MSSEDPVVWHRFRKSLKRYRYTLEMLDEEVSAVVINVLDSLGQVQDAQILLTLLEVEAWLPSYRERMIERALNDQEQARQAVRGFADELNRHFERALPSA